MAVVYALLRSVSSHVFKKDRIEASLVQDDMRLVRQTRRGIGSPLVSYQSAIGLWGPECQFQDVVRLPKQRICDTEALEDFHGATLDAVCLANFQRSVACLEESKADAKLGEP